MVNKTVKIKGIRDGGLYERQMFVLNWALLVSSRT